MSNFRSEPFYNGETALERGKRWAREEKQRVERDTALGVYYAIERLRANEGASITIFCDEHTHGTVYVEVTDGWTNWMPLRYYGATLLAALQNAEHEKMERGPVL